MALIYGLIPAFMYTIKAFAIRVYANDYEPWDLGIDGLILE